MTKCFISLFYKHLPTFPKITNWRDCLFIIVYTCLFCHRLIDHQFSSVYSLSCVWLFATPGLQHTRPPCPSPASRVYSNSCPLSLKCHPAISSSDTLLYCPQSFPASGTSNESAIHIRWPKYWSFSFSISPSNKFSGLISLKIDWFHLLAVQGTLRSLLQLHSLKASILQLSTFLTVQLSQPYMTTGKTIALTIYGPL